MPKITVNGKEIEFEKAWQFSGFRTTEVEIPRFCYHEKLSIAGNCRMCLVEMEITQNFNRSCAMPAVEGMKLKFNTNLVEKQEKELWNFSKSP